MIFDFRKLFALVGALVCVGILSLSAQAVDRQYVLVEDITGVRCTNCPAAANGIHDMMAAGLKIATIGYHWDYFSSNLNNPTGQERITYYYPGNPSGVDAPTVIFDGTEKVRGGGGATVSMYNKYLPVYNSMIEKKSPVYIEIVSNEKIANEEWNVVVKVTKKDPAFDDSSAKLRIALTESNIPYSWLSLETVEDVERAMYPNATGVPVVFDAQNTFTYTATVKMSDDWKYYNCEIIAFVQSDEESREVYQANKVRLSDRILAFPKDIALSADPCSQNINVTWSAGDYNKVVLLGYDVYDSNKKINSNIITGNSYLVEKAAIGNNCLSVVAVYDLGVSPKSYKECVEVKYTEGVTGLAYEVDMNVVNLSWEAPKNVVDDGICKNSFLGYNIYRDSKKINNVPVNTNSYKDVVESIGSYLYYVTAVYQYAESYRSGIVMVEVTTVGVNEAKLESIEVYPNPVINVLTVVGDDVERCTVTDITGKVVIGTENMVIDFSSLERGLYIVDIQTLYGNKRVKVIKR